MALDISRLKEHTEEILTLENFNYLIKTKTPLVHYIGFEISGPLHLGSAFMSAIVIKDLQDLGVKCRIFLADWHSWINEKLGGDLKLIKTVGVDYYKIAFKICLEIVGVDVKKIDFFTGSDLYHNNDKYWLTVVEISKNVTLSRILRSVDILGREAGEEIEFAKLLYPPMQIADIFISGSNIVHAGMDQRKAHVIALQVAPKLKFAPLLSKTKEKIKPVAIHHHLLTGLRKPPSYPFQEEKSREFLFELKMSKSKPESAIFITDSKEEISEKIKKAFCPPNDTSFNPIFDLIYYLILPIFKEIKIKTVNNKEFYIKEKDRPELLNKYQKGEIHPLDLKETVNFYLDQLLTPVREYFSSGKAKRVLEKFKNLYENTTIKL